MPICKMGKNSPFSGSLLQGRIEHGHSKLAVHIHYTDACFIHPLKHKDVFYLLLVGSVLGMHTEVCELQREGSTSALFQQRPCLEQRSD